MKGIRTVSACLVFVVAAVVGCGEEHDGYSCGLGDDDLAADLARIEGTSRTFELSDDDGVLRVDVTFADQGAVASRCDGGFLAALSDLLVPPAHAGCGAPSVQTTLTHTATWTPTGGTPEVLSDVDSAPAWYTLASHAVSVFAPEGTALESRGWGVDLVFVSCGSDARELRLVGYSNPGAQRSIGAASVCE